ncbi:MAG: hypothetical protein PHH13_01870 [Candidatus Peribacteraceae bacterium]|nr:hypothetical protein [Candidatus Peribacteraceae bacterium]
MASPERHLRYEDLEGRRMMSTVTPAAIDLERDSAQYLSIPDANQRGLDLQGDFTVECRFRLESAPGTDEYRPLLSKWTGGASAGRAYTFVYINLGGTPKICVNLSADGTNVTSKTIDYTFQPGTWYDIAFSFKASSGTVDVYVDGEQIGSMTGFPTTIKDSAADAALGNFLGETFDGQIDEMRVWAVTRSGEEIAANRRMDLQGDEAGLVSDWRFNDNVLTDAALSGNTFVNRGGAVFSSDVLTVQQRVQETTAAVDAVMGEGNNPEGDPEHVILSPSKGDMLTPSSVQEQQNIEARGSTELTMTQACLDASESPETPITPTIRIAEIAGNTVLVSLASPEDASTVVIGGCGGILQQETLSHAGGTELAMAKVTMNRVTPPGRYPLALFGPSSSQAITSIEVDWNGQTLSLVHGEDQWDAVSQAEQTAGRGMAGVEQLKGDLTTAQAAVTVFGKQMALTSTNLDGFPELKRLQVADLYERCNPAWKIEVGEVRSLVAARYPTASADTIRYTADALESQMYAYYDGIGEVLASALEVYRQVEHGGDQDRLLENLRSTITRVSTSRYVIEIVVGLGKRFPTDEQAILADALRLYNAETTLNVLAYRQSEQDRLYGISNKISDNPAFQIEVLGQAPTPDVVYASAENGYQGYLDVSQARIFQRIATRTAAVLALSPDPRAQLVASASGQWNMQRERAIAAANEISAGTTVATTLQSDDSQPPASGTFTREGLYALGEWIGEVSGIAVNLGKIDREKIDTETVHLTPGKTATITFELQEPSMVNLWIDMGEADPATQVAPTDGTLDSPNLSLTLKGGGIEYSSDNEKEVASNVTSAGESVSSVLPAGTYTLMVQDLSDYSNIGTPTPGVSIRVPVNYEIRPYKTQNIIGRVSIPNRPVTMPVSMGVAAFDGQGSRVTKDPETGEDLKLNPSKPVFVVIHGRKDNEGSANIEYLAQQLYSQGYQVVTVNWEDAARDNGMLLEALAGADWIPAVGGWVANQLQAAGFKGENVIIPGHSWGSFVAYEVGKQFKEGKNGNGFGVQAIVALDSPVDPLPNHYPSSQVAFSDVSRTSWAIKSSAFGWEGRANTASVNFELLTPSEMLERQLVSLDILSPSGKTALDLAEAYLREHGYAVSYFANLIRGDGDVSLSPLTIDKLMRGELPNLAIDPTCPEGILPIAVREVDGKWQAVPTTLLSPAI